MHKIIVNARFLTQSVTGVQRFAIEICKILKNKIQQEVHFVAPSNIIQKEIAKILDVEIIGNRTGHLWEQMDLPKYLKKKGSPLLLNLCNTAPLFYNNKIVTIHDVGFETFPQTYSKGFLLFYKFLIPRIIKSSKKVITVSEFSKKEIIKFYKTSSDKIDIVFNAAGKEFTPMKNKSLENENYFLAVSSLNYRKNLPLVLNAFEDFIKKHSDYKLFIVGGMDTKSFSNLDLDRFKNVKGIEFKGRVSDDELIEYYSNANAFIYPSFYEGFGIPPLEAQCCGCPAIIANSSCLPEIFGESALYCNPNEIQSLVQQMQNIIQPEIREKIVKLGDTNKQKYTWLGSSEKVYDIIKEIQQ